MTTRSYVVGLLRHLHAFGETSSLDLWRMLDKARGRRVFVPKEPQQGTALVESVLSELAELGVVVKGTDGWLLGRSEAAGGSYGHGKPPVGSRGTVPPRSPPPDDGGGADGQGGGNLGEVLRHPVLFALDRADFEAAVDRALTEFG